MNEQFSGQTGSAANSAIILVQLIRPGVMIVTASARESQAAPPS